MRLNRKNKNDKMKKADKTPFAKWEKGLLCLEILAVLLLGASIFFMLVDINQQYGIWEIFQITTATLAIISVFCYVHFSE